MIADLRGLAILGLIDRVATPKAPEAAPTDIGAPIAAGTEPLGEHAPALEPLTREDLLFLRTTTPIDEAP